MKQNLKRFYQDRVISQLCNEYDYQNIHQIPSLNKVTVNQRLGERAQNTRVLNTSSTELAIITTQRGITTR
jgi:large subunit ribosomal protein L5